MQRIAYCDLKWLFEFRYPQSNYETPVSNNLLYDLWNRGLTGVSLKMIETQWCLVTVDANDCPYP